MNFTREPIIETVITPREGCKLVVRSSKGVAQEDYFVDAVEVVSFGHSFFYRSLERPKSFLVPVSDYEILELKETRMVLKSATTDRSIKIGGGREAPMRPREPEREEVSPTPEGQPPMDRKRDNNKRRRGRRGRDRDREEAMPRPAEPSFPPSEGTPSSPSLDQAPIDQGEVKAPSFISKLFPPPSTLIKETLSRYKPVEPTDEDDLMPSSGEMDTFDEKISFEETIYEPLTPPEPPSLDEPPHEKE